MMLLAEQGAGYGAGSQDPAIVTWAESSHLTETPRCPWTCLLRRDLSPKFIWPTLWTFLCPHLWGTLLFEESPLLHTLFSSLDSRHPLESGSSAFFFTIAVCFSPFCGAYTLKLCLAVLRLAEASIWIPLTPVGTAGCQAHSGALACPMSF